MVGRAGTNTFRVDVPAGENPRWPFHALQVVKKALGQPKEAGPKINKKVVAAQRMEALNISPAEVAAALAAPAARDKRDRKPRVDYAALATKGRGRTRK